MANWRLAKSLDQLRKQINTASPGRSKASDGTIGDAAHASRGDASDHNPWFKDSNGVPTVSGMDITHDPGDQVSGTVLSRALITDSRVKYVIFDGQIWKARTGKWEVYRASNKHRQHVHISVKPESINDVRPWPWPAFAEPAAFVKSGFIGEMNGPADPPVSAEDALAEPKPTVDVVTIKKEEPTPSTEPVTTPGIKGSLVGVLTFATTSLSGIAAALGGWPTTIIIALFAAAAVVGAVWLILRFWYANNDAQRKKDEKEKEAARAHEITILKMKSAMNPDAPTVRVTDSSAEETK